MIQLVKEEPQKAHVDDVFDEFGIFGRYHLQLMMLIIIAFTANSAHSDNYVFAAKNVGYRCKKPFNNASLHACASLSNSTVCAEWEYDDPDSFVAEFGLACQEWKRTFVGTVHCAGYMVGLLIIGPLSDRLGRKIVIVSTGVLGGVFGLAKSFASSYWFYIAMEFLESAIGDICSPVYVLKMEIVSARNKIPYNMLCSLGFVFGRVILAAVAWLVPYWRTFLQVMYAPAFLFFFYLYILDESPRWLLTRGRKKKAVKILLKAAKKNKITLDKNTLNNLSCEDNERVKFVDLLVRTFKSGILRLRFFVCLTWWITSTFVHYGMIINSVSLQGNKYVNFALTSVVALPGILLNMYILLHFNRKRPLMISFFLGGIMCLVHPFIPVDLPWLSVAVYMVGKLISAIYFGITYMYTLELFPTYTRNSMLALCSSLGRLGSITAQQTPLLLPIWTGFPTMLFGLSAVIAGLTTLLVPDVSNEVLPDTVQEAEAIGQSMFLLTPENEMTELKRLTSD